MRPLLVLPLALLAACPKESEPPGDLYGVYTTVGSLAVHECGLAAVPVDLPYERVYELRRTDTGLGYLFGSDGSGVHGTLGEKGGFRFTEQSGLHAYKGEEFDFEGDEFTYDPDVSAPGCDLIVTTTIEGSAPRTLDAESEEEYVLGTLEGTLTTNIRPAPGSNCSKLLASAGFGGQFEALPCNIVLDLEGVPHALETDEDQSAE